MADVTANVRMVYQSGDGQRSALFTVHGCTAGDTFDVFATITQVKFAVMMGDTLSAMAQLAAATASTRLTGANSVLTVAAGPSNDAIWVLVKGVAA